MSVTCTCIRHQKKIWRRNNLKWTKFNALLLLADWFAWKNLDDTIIFIQYLLLFLFRLVQLLTRKILSNLEVFFQAHKTNRRATWAQSFIHSRWLYNTINDKFKLKWWLNMQSCRCFILALQTLREMLRGGLDLLVGGQFLLRVGVCTT